MRLCHHPVRWQPASTYVAGRRSATYGLGSRPQGAGETRDGGRAVHELGITQGIIDRAREAAQANGALRVTDLYLTMTPASISKYISMESWLKSAAGVMVR